jgi:hypothetical protein
MVYGALSMGFASGTASRVKEAFRRLGVATFYLSRLAWGSVMSWLGVCFHKEVLEPVAWFTYLLQDETPMKMRVATEKEKDGSDVEGLDIDMGAGDETVVVKVLQSELICGFVVKVVATGIYNIIWAELPTCLQKVDSTIGVALRYCMDQNMAAPLAHAVRSRFPVEVHMSTSDRAASNLKMEKLMTNDRPGVPRLCCLGCQVHCAHTIAGKTLDLTKLAISGAISLALAEEKAGAVKVLRSAIALVLKDVERSSQQPCLMPHPSYL